MKASSLPSFLLLLGVFWRRGWRKAINLRFVISHFPFSLTNQRPTATTNSPSGRGEGEGIAPHSRKPSFGSQWWSSVYCKYDSRFQIACHTNLENQPLFRRRTSSYKLHVTLPTALSWESPWLHIHPPQKLTTADRFFPLFIGWPLSLPPRSWQERTVIRQYAI